MKLHNVPHNTKIRVLGNIAIPPASPIIQIGDILYFRNLDTMYSRCENENGETVYLFSLAEVEIID
jgi:hypothetical protein